MRKVFILLMTVSLFVSCDNDKGMKADYRDKDDYSNTDDKDKDEQSDDKTKKDDNQTDFTGGGGWAEADKSSMLNECMTQFGTNQELGRKICPCALEKFEKKYSSYAEANRLGGEAVGKQIGEECLKELNINPNNNNDNNNNPTDDNQNNAGGSWPESEKQGFVKECVNSAQKGGMEYLDAQSYCDCMQYKLEKMYPNVNDSRLKTLSLESPAMQKMVQSCKPGN